MASSTPHPDPADLSSAILTAPGWARVGITMPDVKLRERAAEALAQAILDQIFRAPYALDADQLSLSL